MMLLSRANSGARGNAAQKMVRNPNWRTEIRNKNKFNGCQNKIKQSLVRFNSTMNILKSSFGVKYVYRQMCQGFTD